MEESFSSFGNSILKRVIDPNNIDSIVELKMINDGLSEYILSYISDNYSKDLAFIEANRKDGFIDNINTFAHLAMGMQGILLEMEREGVIPAGSASYYNNLIFSGINGSNDVGASLGETDLPPISDDNGYDKAPGAGNTRAPLMANRFLI